MSAYYDEVLINEQTGIKSEIKTSDTVSIYKHYKNEFAKLRIHGQREVF
jgi:hypothetical protein